MSDTHNDTNSISHAIEQQPTANTILHLGDFHTDVEVPSYLYDKKEFIQVSGNCDSNSSVPITRELDVLGKKIFMTHGHMYSVKESLNFFLTDAKNRRCNIALYGHTHVPMNTYQSGIYVMNPGSLKGKNATYGIIDIFEDGSINTQIIKLYK